MVMQKSMMSTKALYEPGHGTKMLRLYLSVREGSSGTRNEEVHIADKMDFASHDLDRDELGVRRASSLSAG